MEDLIAIWVREFQSEVEAYLRLQKLRRTDLAEALDMAQSSISRNLQPGAMPTENFIRAVSERVPGFADAWKTYLAAKAGGALPSAVREAPSTYRDQYAEETLAELHRLAREIEKKIDEFEANHRKKADDDEPR